MITGVGQVIIDVDDQQRAKAFWTEAIGFEVVTDAPYGEERWIEVAPPDGAPLFVLSQRRAGEMRREVSKDLPHSPVFFTCKDIEATHRELSVEPSAESPAARSQYIDVWTHGGNHDGNRRRSDW